MKTIVIIFFLVLGACDLGMHHHRTLQVSKMAGMDIAQSLVRYLQKNGYSTYDSFEFDVDIKHDSEDMFLLDVRLYFKTIPPRHQDPVEAARIYLTNKEKLFVVSLYDTVLKTIERWASINDIEFIELTQLFNLSGDRVQRAILAY